MGRPPCEIIVKYILPMIRASLAKELVIELGLTQEKAAKRLGITQSAVSRYIKEQRGMTEFSENEELVSSIQEFIENECGGDEEKITEVAQNICIICKSLRGKPEISCIPNSK